MPILRETKKLDSKGRVFLPQKLLDIVNLKGGDEVYFETTKTNAIVIRKLKKESGDKQ